jgi:hypothetical protein
MTSNLDIHVGWRGDTVTRRARRGADRGVEAGAEHVRDVSVARAPERTGALRASALTYRHDDGGPKFLETALVSERGAVARARAGRDP